MWVAGGADYRQLHGMFVAGDDVVQAYYILSSAIKMDIVTDYQ